MPLSKTYVSAGSLLVVSEESRIVTWVDIVANWFHGSQISVMIVIQCCDDQDAIRSPGCMIPRSVSNGL